ncbi:four helix bundle protein [Verrucomicrobiota bacterium]
MPTQVHGSRLVSNEDEDIEAWQLARELARKVCRLTKTPGFAKDYGLKRQIHNAFSVHRSGFLVAEIPICFQP